MVVLESPADRNTGPIPVVSSTNLVRNCAYNINIPFFFNLTTFSTKLAISFFPYLGPGKNTAIPQGWSESPGIARSGSGLSLEVTALKSWMVNTVLFSG